MAQSLNLILVQVMTSGFVTLSPTPAFELTAQNLLKILSLPLSLPPSALYLKVNK